MDGTSGKSAERFGELTASTANLPLPSAEAAAARERNKIDTPPSLR